MRCDTPRGLLVGAHSVDVFVAQRNHSALSARRWGIACGICASESGDTMEGTQSGANR